MDEKDIYWVAGFFQGEGCFYIGIRKNINKNREKVIRISPRIKITQKNPLILKEIREKLGYGYIRNNGRNVFVLEISKRKELLMFLNTFENKLFHDKKESCLKFKEIINSLNYRESFKEYNNRLDKIVYLKTHMNKDYLNCNEKYLKLKENLIIN